MTREFYVTVAPRGTAVIWNAFRLSTKPTPGDDAAVLGTVLCTYRRNEGSLIVVVRMAERAATLRLSCCMTGVPKFIPEIGDSLSILFPVEPPPPDQ